METQTKRKPGPVAGNIKTKKYSVLLEPEYADWAMHQPGGMSELMRRLIKEARDAEAKLIEEEDRLWDATTARPGFAERLNAMGAEAEAECDRGECVPLETFLIEISEEMGDPLTAEQIAELQS